MLKYGFRLNDFELGKILGKGSFGTVTLVTRKEDKKIYAMKRLNIGKLDEYEKCCINY